MRLIEFFDLGVSLDRNRPCLIDERERRPFGEVQQASHRIARQLMKLGVTRDSKVAVLSPNSAAAFECVLGILRLGAVWVPINARNSPADTAQMLGRFDVDVLFIAGELAPQLERLRSSCPRIGTYICIDTFVPGTTSMRGWREEPCDPVPLTAEQPESLATIFGSGGTTGLPKGVMHSHLTWATLIAGMRIAIPPRKPPVHLVVAPMTHAAGAMALCLLPLGATQIIMGKFEPLEVLHKIQDCGVTHLFLPPTAIYQLLSQPDVRRFDYSSLEYFIYAAAPMSVEKLREAIEVFGPVMTQVYGQTEAPMLCTCFSPSEHAEALESKPKRLLSCGRAGFLTPTEIMDDEGNLLGTDAVGEIVVRGNLVMLGYYNDPQGAAEVRTADGWHRTGDIGWKDNDGYVYIVDRKRDLIISGGFNVFPSEVEQVIWAHPGVQDCAVVGVPDAKWGEAVKAIVELRPGATVTEADIIRACKERLGSIKAPKSVEFWDCLPRTAVGKVSKRGIRAVFWRGRERAI